MKRPDILKTLALLFLISTLALTLTHCGSEEEEDPYTYIPLPGGKCDQAVSSAYNNCLNSKCSDCVGFACLFCMAECDSESDRAAYDCCSTMYSGQEYTECIDRFIWTPPTPAEPPAYCYISGLVNTADDAGLQDVEQSLVITGHTEQYTEFTDSRGYYSFMLEGFSCSSYTLYTITPSKTGYCFSPENLSIIPRSNTDNYTHLDFTSSLACFSISGTITSQEGVPVPGVTVELSGNLSASAVTNASGHYIFSNLRNGTYTITPSQISAPPESRTVTLYNADISGQDFWGIAYAISGMINAADGTPIPGVTVTLTGDDSNSTTSDKDGKYTFHVFSQGSYNVIPSPPCPDYPLEPPSRTLTIVEADLLAQNFWGPVISTGISGRITTLAGLPFPDVTVTLLDAASTSTTTDLNGDYAFSGIQAGGAYTITPSYTDHSFSPEERTEPLCEGGLSGQDFLGRFTTWAKSYGRGDLYPAGNFRDMQQTSDGGYIVAGYISPGVSTNKDIWVLKLDASGNVLWQMTYGGTHDDYAYSIRETSDSGFIVAGSTPSFGAGGADIWVLKLDASGNVLWQKAYGGTGTDVAYSIRETSDGGFIVAGGAYMFGDGGHSDIWVLKLDASGNVLWQKGYGGMYSDIAYSIRETSDSGFIVAGSTPSFGAGGADIWVLKLDASGNVLWQKAYGGTGTDVAYSIRETSDGGFIVAGITASFGAGDTDIWVLRLDASGNVLWQKAYGSTWSEYSYFIRETSDSGFIVGGGATKILVLKLDASGNVLWRKEYGGTARSIMETSGGGYIMSGFLYGAVYAPAVLKVDPNGNLDFCEIVRTPKATVTETNASIMNTPAAITNTSASITNTTAVPQDSSASETQICPAQ